MAIKETMRQSGYKYAGFDRQSRMHKLVDTNGRLELWFANKGHASYGIKWRNTDLEFARSEDMPSPIYPR